MLFVRRFARKNLYRRAPFEPINSGKVALLLLRATTEKELLRVILPQILEVNYDDYDFLEYTEDEMVPEQEDLTYFLQNCTQEEYRFLVEAALFARLNEQYETGCNLEDDLAQRFSSVPFTLVKKHKYAAILIDYYVHGYPDAKDYIPNLHKIDEATSRELKYRYYKYFALRGYGPELDYSSFSPKMCYVLARVQIEKIKYDFKENVQKLLEKLAEQGFIFTAEGYREAFWGDAFINCFERTMSR